MEAISKKRGKLMTQGRLFSERSPKDNSKVLAHLVFLWLFLQTDGSSVALVNFYVSVSGKDQWSGRSVSPNGELSVTKWGTERWAVCDTAKSKRCHSATQNVKGPTGGRCHSMDCKGDLLPGKGS